MMAVAPAAILRSLKKKRQENCRGMALPDILDLLSQYKKLPTPGVLVA